MADNITGALGSIDWINVIGGVPGVSDLITIGKAVGIAFLIYIIFLIIRSITQILYSLRFKRLTRNVEEINQKMDVLISHLSGKESKATKMKK
jgi:hypothetical protein